MSTEATHSSAYAATLSGDGGAADWAMWTEQTGVVCEDMRYRSGSVVRFKLGVQTGWCGLGGNAEMYSMVVFRRSCGGVQVG